MIKIVDVKTEALLYPEGYFDFTDGESLSNNEIRAFIFEGIEEGIKKMKDGKLNEAFYTISTGNVKVFVEIYKQKDELLTIDISVCTSYTNKIYCNISA